MEQVMESVIYVSYIVFRLSYNGKITAEQENGCGICSVGLRQLRGLPRLLFMDYDTVCSRAGRAAAGVRPFPYSSSGAVGGCYANVVLLTFR
jgi:hypothetical protein